MLILLGFIVLNGSLKLSSRSTIAGAVRLCYAIMNDIFLGLRLSIGGTSYEKFTRHVVMNWKTTRASILVLRWSAVSEDTWRAVGVLDHPGV